MDRWRREPAGRISGKCRDDHPRPTHCADGPHLSDVGEGTAPGASDRRLLILGGLSGIAAGPAYFAGQAVLPGDYDLPVESAQWTSC